MSIKKVMSYGLNIAIVAVLAILIGRYFYMKPKYARGEAAPAFSSTTLGGQAFQLEQLKGQFVLLDFWGSWCGPCRAEAHKLVELHREFSSKALTDKGGLVIVNVGIESNEGRWKRAIEKDGLNWPHHVMDKSTNLRFFNGEISGLYGIKEVPSKYLLNPKGEIIAVNPGFDEIYGILNSQLN